MSTDRGVDKEKWPISTHDSFTLYLAVVDYSAIKKKEIPPFATTQMELEGILLR